MMTEQQAPRVLSRSETHDLSMIIRDRTKVLKAHAEAQAAACMADFERKLASAYSFDDDETWKKAHGEAHAAAVAAQEIIIKRCEELGIPKTFAPGVSLEWHGRGENAMAGRRVELRRLAKASIEAMKAAAVTKIEQQSLDLRTQVVGMGLLSPEAKMFLESLAPVTEAMHALDFHEIELKLEREHGEREAIQRRLGRY